VQSYSQVRITKATSQKVIGGRSGVFMNYEIALKSKRGDSLMIDSVITIAEQHSIHIAYNKTEKRYCELTFSFALFQPEKCNVCPDVNQKPANLTKGVNIYYRKGEKLYRKKLRKFKVLTEKISQ